MSQAEWDALQEESRVLLEQRRGIDEQLEVFKIREKAGEPVDYEWRLRAKIAYKKKGVRLQAINRRIAELNREFKKANMEISAEQTRSFERQFMMVAKEMLNPEIYLGIMRETAQRLGDANGNR